MRGDWAVLMAIAVIGLTMFLALSFSSIMTSIFNMYLIMIVMTGAAVAKGMFGRHKTPDGAGHGCRFASVSLCAYCCVLECKFLSGAKNLSISQLVAISARRGVFI